MAQRLRCLDRPAAYNPFGKETWRILYQAPDTGKVNRINREDTKKRSYQPSAVSFWTSYDCENKSSVGQDASLDDS
jgi:hypothetical protein